LEQGTNTDKWQEQEKIGTDKKTSTIEIKINPLPPTIPLGRFKRVTLIKKESDCVLDAVNDGYQLRCVAAVRNSENMVVATKLSSLE